MAEVNCSFYFKIGACRHGEQCSRLHNKPTFSQTILLQNLYIAPHNTAQTADGSHINMTETQAQQIFDEFFEEVFVECEEKVYGEIEEMNVCDNLGDHLVGNVYIKFRYEEDAEKAVLDLNQRWFGGRPVHAELSPVTDFREACCRQYELGYGKSNTLQHARKLTSAIPYKGPNFIFVKGDRSSAATDHNGINQEKGLGHLAPWFNLSFLFSFTILKEFTVIYYRECTRGGFCNFMHLKPISRELCRKLYNRSKKRYGRRHRSRSRDRRSRRSRSRERRSLSRSAGRRYSRY
ncbi:unnamed protein product [Protopolystoma xenopodis]|uniref:C3H1-type domain-containing protein n=1 Tax=Protopolystoma xenopodis TaxID=117903 RepID=A0A448WDL2_9PLAT|nr:unnamed protein product [Protopolystoma xenopodis]